MRAAQFGLEKGFLACPLETKFISEQRQLLLTTDNKGDDDLGFLVAFFLSKLRMEPLHSVHAEPVRP